MTYPVQVIFSDDVKTADAATLQEKASHLFNQAASHHAFKRIWARMTGKPYALASLNDLARQGDLLPGAYLGTKTIDICHVCGSEDRAADFDREFHPISNRTRERWIGVARAWLRNQSLPPVELIEVDGCYFVRDGHHRLSVARTIGQRYIEADVTKFHFRPAL